MLEALVAEYPAEPSYRAALVEGCITWGHEVRFSSDRPQEAEALLRRALELVDGKQPEHGGQLARILLSLTVAQWHSGRFGEAEATARRSLAASESFSQRFPTNPEHHETRAHALELLGFILARTDLAEAERVCRQELDLRNKLLSEAPARQENRLRIAWVQARLAWFLQAKGRLAETEELYRQCIAVAEKVVADFPTRLNYRSALGVWHLQLGALLETTNRSAEAEQAYRRAWAVSTVNLPAMVEPLGIWSDRLIRIEGSLVGLLATAGKKKDIEAHYRQALLLWEKLAAQHPGPFSYQSESMRMRTYRLLADFLMANDRKDEANDLLRQASRRLEEMVRSQRTELVPHDDKTRRNLDGLADCHAALGRHAEALRIREQLLKVYQEAQHKDAEGVEGWLLNQTGLVPGDLPGPEGPRSPAHSSSGSTGHEPQAAAEHDPWVLLAHARGGPLSGRKLEANTGSVSEGLRTPAVSSESRLDSSRRWHTGNWETGTKPGATTIWPTTGWDGSARATRPKSVRGLGRRSRGVVGREREEVGRIGSVRHGAKKRPVGSLPPSKPPPARHRPGDSVCALGTMSSHPNAGQVKGSNDDEAFEPIVRGRHDAGGRARTGGTLRRASRHGHGMERDHASDGDRRPTNPVVQTRGARSCSLPSSRRSTPSIGDYEPYLGVVNAPAWASPDAAAIAAAHRTLVTLRPDQAEALDAQRAASLAAIPDGPAKDAGIAAGEDAATAMLLLRANDGWDAVVTYTPGTNPGDWQPTPPPLAPAFLPAWGLVTPFGLESGSQFRARRRRALRQPQYARDYNEVKLLGRIDSPFRPQDRTDVARFYAAASPVEFWNTAARQVSAAQGMTLSENARIFALLGMAMGDAAIAVWDTKYHYNLWRPLTAIRTGDLDGNARHRAGSGLAPLIATPAHPSYGSGHATVSGAAAGCSSTPSASTATKSR